MNKRALCVLVSLLASACLSLADGERLPTLKVGPNTFTNVTILSVTSTDIYFSHSQGMGNAKLKNLSPELQKEFHFNPDRAAERERQQSDDKALYAQVVQKEKATPVVRPVENAGDVPGPAGLPDEVLPHEIAAKSFLNQRGPPIIAEKWLTPAPNLSGKFLLLTFWGTWSDPCKEMIPKLNAFSQDFQDRLVVVCLTDEPEEQVSKMTNPKTEFAIAIDTQRRASEAYNVQKIPHTVLVDPRGVVRFEGHPGYLDEKKLEKLLTRFAD